MIKQKSKSKCTYGCGKRSSWLAIHKNGCAMRACGEHKHRLEGMSDPQIESDRMTEADYQIQDRYGI